MKSPLLMAACAILGVVMPAGALLVPKLSYQVDADHFLILTANDVDVRFIHAYLQASTDLSGTNWVFVQTNANTFNGTVVFSGIRLTGTNQFFRVWAALGQ